MATVKLSFTDGGRRLRMPNLCIVCGDPECEPTRVSFSSRFFKATFGAFGQEYRRVLTTTVPLCADHTGHFTGQLLFGCASLLLILFIPAGIAIGSAAWVVGGSIWGVPPALALIALAIVGLIFVGAGAGGAVQAREITERSITLINVHRDFARAAETGDWNGAHQPRRKHTRKPRPRSTLPLLLVGGAGLVVLAVGIGIVVWSVRNRFAPVMGGAPPAQFQNQPTEKPAPLPIDAAWNDNAMRPMYLADLNEYDAHAFYPFGKKGMHGFSSTGNFGDRIPIRFNAAAVPNGLSMHVPQTGYARVKYRLDKGFRLLRGAAAMADLTPDAHRKTAESPVVFSILVDGRLLWRSQPLQERGAHEVFRLSVAGVQELELQATPQGSPNYGWSIWIDPVLLQ